MLLPVLLLALSPLPQNDGAALLAMPHAFERHTTPDGDRFVARSALGVLAVDARGATLQTAGGSALPAVRIAFVDQAEPAQVVGEEPTERRVNYYRGQDREAWQVGLTTWSQARCRGVWPGIDVVFHGRGGELEYDFEIAPGADPSSVRLRVSGAHCSLTSAGDLVLAAAGGEMRQRAPLAWQTSTGGRRTVPVRFRLDHDGSIAFELGDYEPSLPLVIDPVVVFVALIDGSSFDQAPRICVDAAGQAAIACTTSSADMPTQSPAQGSLNGNADLFVAKFTADGSNLVFATYLGGAGNEVCGGIAARPDGSVVVGCFTPSNDYPVQSPAFTGRSGAGITVLSPAGAIVWSTYYTIPGSTSNVFARCLDLTSDTNGDVIVCGSASTSGLPVQGGAFQPDRIGLTDGFVARFAAGGAFLAATYFGTSNVNEAFDVAVAANGTVCVGGRARFATILTRNAFQPAFAGGTNDVWLAVFDPMLTTLVYATYYGGTNDEAAPNGEVLGIAVDAQNQVVMGSMTTSSDLPVTANAFQPNLRGASDGFIAKFDPQLTGAASLVYATYLGGDGAEMIADIAMDGAGRYYAVGHTTSSTGLPFVHALRAPPTVLQAGLLAVLDTDGQTLRFCTPFGVPNLTLQCTGVALAANGSILATGDGSPNSVPVTPGAFQTPVRGFSNVFALRLDLPFATASSYGQGHPGTLGEPSLTTSADPILGTQISLLLGNSAGTPTPAVLLIGGSQANVQTPFGGTLLVGGFVAFSVGVGASGGAFPLAIPDDVALCGLPLFAQQAQLDAGASNLLSFSAGLALVLGI